MLKRSTSIIAGLFLLLLLSACSGNSSTPADEQQVALAPTLALGKTVYAENCAACHGTNLEGEADWQSRNADGTWKAPPHNDDGHTWHHPDDYIRGRILNGTAELDATMQAQSNMPAYSDTLDAVEIDAVILYIKSQWSTQVQEMHKSRNP